MSLPEEHALKKLARKAGYEYNVKEGTPLGYLNFVSKEIESKLKEEKLTIRKIQKLSTNILEEKSTIQEVSIFNIELGNSKNRTREQENIAREQFEEFQKKSRE